MDACGGLVEHLFRQEAGRLASSLVRRLGPAHFELAEECVQDALVRALKLWPHQGTPPNPAGWLATTAHRLALDRLRRRSTLQRIHADLAGLVRLADGPAEPAEALDDQLAMMFGACHPALNREAQVALTLKVVCGFSTAEVARAFLAEETAIAQRIVRAKRCLRDGDVPIAVPPEAELPERLDAVLQVIYLLFNEGYAAHAGDDLVRHNLCEEALRLGRLLASRPDTGLPKVHALVALMFFHASRLPARQNGAGDLLRLADQDRTLWDRRLVYAGLRHLDRASEGDEVTTFHLEAGIAAIHAQADSDDATDWPMVLRLYDQLMTIAPTPVIALNRAVAVMRVHGPAAGLGELAPLVPALDGLYLLHSVWADFHARLDQVEFAERAYAAALACPCSEPERRFLGSRLAELRSKVSARSASGTVE
jgi:RNA polymerase sigma-70 factor (ECF subfamily)